MIPLWATGDSLARVDILADGADFSKHSGVQELDVYAALQIALGLRCASRRLHPFPAAALKNRTTLNGRHLNISWRRCIDIDWAEDICNALSTLFTSVSCGRAHLCWQRTGWEDVIPSVPLTFNYFYPHCGLGSAGMTSLLHFHLESFIQRRDRRLTST